MKRGMKYAIAILFVTLCSWSFVAQAQTPRETLNQYISDLQKNPNDYALKEKIIRHVQTMKPAPAIPEEARRHYVMARTLFDDAKSAQDFGLAIDEFKKALTVAPWWQEAYLKLSIALKAAERYGEAIEATKLYMATNPGEELSRKAQDEIYILEAKQIKAQAEKATQEKAVTEAAAVEKKQKGLRDLVGNWYRKMPYDPKIEPYAANAHYRSEMRGDELYIIYVIDVPYWDWIKGEERIFYMANRLEGNKLIGTFQRLNEPGTYEVTVSPDFNDWEFYYSNQYSSGRQTYTRR